MGEVALIFSNIKQTHACMYNRNLGSTALIEENSFIVLVCKLWEKGGGRIVPNLP